MVQQRSVSLENNFTQGLKTENTGLNFPENACTATDNCIFNFNGEVERRRGINYEENFGIHNIARNDCAINTYDWTNAVGDGTISFVVKQVGSKIYFYRKSSATVLSPLSTTLIGSVVDITDFLATDFLFIDTDLECQFTEGDGKLFIFHPNADPIYCTYSGGIIHPNRITIKIRDFKGVDENVEDNVRPTTLTVKHSYNLANQGWNKSWQATSITSNDISVGDKTFVTQSGLNMVVGDRLYIQKTDDATKSMAGIVTSYSGTSLGISIKSIVGTGSSITTWEIAPSPPFIWKWYKQMGNYPSNADITFLFRDTDGLFNPVTTASSVSESSAPAPKGHYLLEAFNQNRETVSGLVGIDVVNSGGLRPSTGTWFAGRLWYSGVKATGYNENIYFSQIVDGENKLGRCYQANDPTSEDNFEELPNDGGLIVIHGAGIIHKLFPIVNGLVIFAEKGNWFITGSSGIGFTANDYVITKISSISTISGTSFVDVLGYPVWCNEEGIWGLSTNQGSLQVKSLTHDSIASFYQSIPLICRKYIRGAYDPLSQIVKWIFRDIEYSNVTDRYSFNRVLSYNFITNAFYPWSLSSLSFPVVNGINFVLGYGDSTTPQSSFKFLTSRVIGPDLYHFTFSDESDEDYVDWAASSSVDYDSYFVTGYKLKGQGQRKFQPNYVHIFSNNEVPTSYQIQGIWDYATSEVSGRYSSTQVININKYNYDKAFRRIKIRGHGKVLQFKVSSVTGKPFGIQGWSVYETINAGV